MLFFLEILQKKNENTMKRKTTIIIIALFLITPFYSFFLIPTAHAQEPVIFVYGTRSEILELDPLLSNGDNQYTLTQLCYEGLYRYENNDPLASVPYSTPWLVESESADASGLHINLTLHQGVKFWNGQELNASVVKWNWDRQKAVGTSWYGEWNGDPFQAVIQSWWYEIEALLADPNNAEYNDSALYPELWWNKDDSRYPAEHWDGTNTTAMYGPGDYGPGSVNWSASFLSWPADIDQWAGRSVWNDEEWGYWDWSELGIGRAYYVPDNVSGNAPGNNRNTNAFDSVTLYPDEPYKLTVNLYVPSWEHMKTSRLYVMGMMFPTGTWNPSTKFWDLGGPGYANSSYWYPTKYDGLILKADVPSTCIGTGPFTFDEYNEAEKYLVLNKNEDYWGGNWEVTNREHAVDPEMDIFILKYYDTDTALYTAALAHELDGFDCTERWLDWRAQIEADPLLTLLGPSATQNYAHFYFNPNEVDYTLRYAMSFAFNYDHFILPDVLGWEAVREQGPFAEALYTDYLTDDLYPTFPRQTEPGFFYNLTEARYYLLTDDPLNRATDRGLNITTDLYTDETWVIMSATNPIANITCMDQAWMPHLFQNFKTYMSKIGINVIRDANSPMTQAQYDNFEVHSNRWFRDVGFHSMTYPEPTLFKWLEWSMDDTPAFDMTDPTDHTLAWNVWTYLTTKVNITSDFGISQGYPGYVPTVDKMRPLVFSLYFQQNKTQLMLDYNSILDQIYQDAISIWVCSANGYSGISSLWEFGNNRVFSGNWQNPWADFTMVGEAPTEAIIPGYSTGIMVSISLVAMVSLAIITKTRRTLKRKF